MSEELEKWKEAHRFLSEDYRSMSRRCMALIKEIDQKSEDGGEVSEDVKDWEEAHRQLSKDYIYLSKKHNKMKLYLEEMSKSIESIQNEITILMDLVDELI